MRISRLRPLAGSKGSALGGVWGFAGLPPPGAGGGRAAKGENKEYRG